MKVLVTGSAGFIGSALTIRLLERGNTVIGVDNHNDYYDPKLKEARLSRHINHPNYTHAKMNIEDRIGIAKLFEDHNFQYVAHLAAQAGVRYSIENPRRKSLLLWGYQLFREFCLHQRPAQPCVGNCSGRSLQWSAFKRTHSG